MREQLKVRDGERVRFRGTVARFGRKSGSRQPTLMLADVTYCENGENATDHVWFSMGVNWRGVRYGDVVEFDARVKIYKKGWRGRTARPGAPPPSEDFRLDRATKVEVIMPRATVNNGRN